MKLRITGLAEVGRGRARRPPCPAGAAPPPLAPAPAASGWAPVTSAEPEPAWPPWPRRPAGRLTPSSWPRPSAAAAAGPAVPLRRLPCPPGPSPRAPASRAARPAAPAALLTRGAADHPDQGLDLAADGRVVRAFERAVLGDDHVDRPLVDGQGRQHHDRPRPEPARADNPEPSTRARRRPPRRPGTRTSRAATSAPRRGSPGGSAAFRCRLSSCSDPGSSSTASLADSLVREQDRDRVRGDVARASLPIYLHSVNYRPPGPLGSTRPAQGVFALGPFSLHFVLLACFLRFLQSSRIIDRRFAHAPAAVVG